MSLNLLDFVFILIILCAVGAGFARGLISEVIALITLVAAVIIATTFAAPLAHMFTSTSVVQHAVDNSTRVVGTDTTHHASYLAIGIAFILLFLGTTLIGIIIRVLLNVIFQAGIVGVGNRIFGALFGIAKAYIYLVIIIFVVQLSSVAKQSWWQNSYFVTLLQPSVQWLTHMTSPSVSHLKGQLNTTLGKVNAKLQAFTKE